MAQYFQYIDPAKLAAFSKQQGYSSEFSGQTCAATENSLPRQYISSEVIPLRRMVDQPLESTCDGDLPPPLAIIGLDADEPGLSSSTCSEIAPPTSTDRIYSDKRKGVVTEKGFKRGYVSHSYRDWSGVSMGGTAATAAEFSNVTTCLTNGVSAPFPLRLHRMLEEADRNRYTDIVSWLPHGRAFLVHDKERFVSEILPKYFKQTQFPSFQRQLNLYGFLRLTKKNADQGAYYHERCLRGMPELCDSLPRFRVNGNAVRQCSSPDNEPNFDVMPVVPIGKNQFGHGGGAFGFKSAAPAAAMGGVYSGAVTFSFNNSELQLSVGEQTQVKTAGDVFCMLYPQQHSRRTPAPEVLPSASRNIDCSGMCSLLGNLNQGQSRTSLPTVTNASTQGFQAQVNIDGNRQPIQFGNSTSGQILSHVPAEFSNPFDDSAPVLNEAFEEEGMILSDFDCASLGGEADESLALDVNASRLVDACNPSADVAFWATV